MRIFKTRPFKRWADSEKLNDVSLKNAVNELSKGLIDANLGGSVYKKRIATQGKGKSGGLRTLIAFRIADKAFFMYGFSKNQRESIDDKELKALKNMAREMFAYSDKVLAGMARQGKLIEVETDE